MASWGFERDGTARDLNRLQHLDDAGRQIGEALRAWHSHLFAGLRGTEAARRKAALDRMVREAAFTTLNRLMALRLCEARGVVGEVIRGGQRAEGFAVFEQVAAGGLGDRDATWRAWLDRLYDELAAELPILFDRRAAASLLSPSTRCLEAVVAILDGTELEPLWVDDETIGWAYQYFHTDKERTAMRKASAAPRDTRELAVRNQFFTQRYVVEFLADNTLGRQWWEMRRGQTALVDQCRYLYREPDAAVPERAPVDPRELRVLDPACGSGHFLLYAFDLLETIWIEAYDAETGRPKSRVPRRRLAPLRELWPDRETFVREVPRLILEHNLWGVDIDPRAAQIAALALWLRTQRSWKNIPAAKRPAVRKTHIVVAEPMPGERDLFEEFAPKLEPPVLGRLVRQVWSKLTPAGELGLLLRVDEELKSVVTATREELAQEDRRRKEPEQRTLGFVRAEPAQEGLFEADLAVLDDEAFWSRAEGNVLNALKAWSETEVKGWDQRRMFAEDAARGFAFVDLCRERFDVALMNPPFGDPTEGTVEWLAERYPACGSELYAMFYQRMLELCRESGRVGAITNRTWLGLQSLEGLRVRVFGPLGNIAVAADLGSFVLEAQVETAAVVVDRGRSRSGWTPWVRLLKSRRKEAELARAVQSAADGTHHSYLFQATATAFDRLPTCVFGYWMSATLIEVQSNPGRVGTSARPLVGLQTSDDHRFLRLAWEVRPDLIGLNGDWPRYAKGGEYRPYYDDVHLTVRWSDGGREISAFPKAYPRNSRTFGSPGVTWPRRTTMPFSPRVFPSGLAYGDKGPVAFPESATNLSVLLGCLVARPARLLLSVRLGAGDDAPGSASKSYEVGLVRDLPWPKLTDTVSRQIATMTEGCVLITRQAQVEEDDTGETVVAYTFPPSLTTARARGSLQGAAEARALNREETLKYLASATAEIDRLVADAYGFTERDREVLDEELERPLAELSDTANVDPALFKAAYLTKKPIPGDHLPGGLDAEVDVRVEHRRGKQVRLRDETMLCRLFGISPRRLAQVRRDLRLLRPEDVTAAAMDLVHYAVGVAFGRWDLRLALNPALVPGWPDAFGALPRCPVGQLVNADGLPATPDRVATLAWLAARTDASKLPKVEVRQGVYVLADSGELAEAPAASVYDVPVAWSGLLSEDDGVSFDPDDPIVRPPTTDLARRVEDVFTRLFGDHATTLLQDCCSALGVDSVRAYLRAPAGFFADHLSRYSKSRRKAPIYWPLSVDSGLFTAWIYYPRLNSQTLHGLLNELLVPRLGRVQAELDRLEARLEKATGKSAERLVEARDRAKKHITDLLDMKDVIDGVIALPFAPDLDDGVVINAAPLRTRFRHKPWRDHLDTIWEGLMAGDFDWAHLAMTLRRDEVLEACKEDRSIAIAHGREDLTVASPKKKKGRVRSPGLFDEEEDE